MRTFKNTLIIVFISLLGTSCTTDFINENENLLIGTDTLTETTLNLNNIPEITEFEWEILDLINVYRVNKGLQKLIPLETILIPAQEHTMYMIENAAMSHDNFHERAAFLFANEAAEYVSENVAVGFTKAENLVNAWIASPTHRANIEGNVNYFHVYANSDENGVWYFTNLFLRK